MNVCRGGGIREDYLAALVHLGVLLVAVIGLAALLGPTGINVLVALLVRLVFPQFVTLALLLICERRYWHT